MKILRWQTILQLAMATTWLALTPSAYAVLGCTMSATINTLNSYSATATLLGDTEASGGIVITCTRNGPSDATNSTIGYVKGTSGAGTFTFSATKLIVHNDGVNGSTIAKSSANSLDYGLFQSAGGVWGTTNTTGIPYPVASLTFGSGVNIVSTASIPFKLKVPLAQWTSPEGNGGTNGPPAYTDTSVTVTATHGTTDITTTFIPTIKVNAVCSYPTFPAALDFGDYNSLGSSAASINKTLNFDIQCTKNATPSFAFDAAASTIPGVSLNYTLTAPAGFTSLNGASVQKTISGTMQGGQSGTCATTTCSTSFQTRTLIVSY